VSYTGEHGNSLSFMREIKNVADPKNIMNPGKLFTDEDRPLPERLY
jgi:FAD/FMN-containing dehydrogenase